MTTRANEPEGATRAREAGPGAYESAREARVRAEDASAEGVEISMSTEAPVRTWVPGVGLAREILVHEPGAVRLERMNGGAAVLVNHSMHRYAGRVREGSARVDADRKLRGFALFADTDDGQMLGRNVPRGFLTQTSIGYRVNRYEVEENEDGGLPTVRATDWEPYEVSFVSVPADTGAGAGRSMETLGDQMSEKAKKGAAETPAGDEGEAGGAGSVRAEGGERAGGNQAAQELAKLAQREGERRERERASEIDALARQFHYVEGLADAARQAVNEGTSSRDFEAHVLEMVRQHVEAVKPNPRGGLDLSRGDRNRYSLSRALHAAMAIATKTGDASRIAPHEMAISAEMQDKMTHREASGILIPLEALDGGAGWPIPRFVSPAQQRAHEIAMMQRATPMGVGTSGTNAAAMVGTAHLAGSFIEALRPSTVVLAAGATVLPGLSMDVEIPKQTGRGTTHWIGEDVDPDDTEIPIGLVRLRPKTIAADVPITRRMILQGGPAVEMIVRNDLVLGIAEAIDDAALEGPGSDAKPLGIWNTVDVLTSAIATDAAPTYAEMIALMTVCEAANALRSGQAWVTTPTLRGTLRTTPKDSGSGRYVVENNEIDGTPILATSQLGTNRVIFGSFSELLVGQFGVLDVMVDQYTDAGKRRLILRVTQDIDIAVRHAQAFSKGT